MVAVADTGVDFDYPAFAGGVQGAAQFQGEISQWTLMVMLLMLLEQCSAEERTRTEAPEVIGDD